MAAVEGRSGKLIATMMATAIELVIDLLIVHYFLHSFHCSSTTLRECCHISAA